MPPEPQSRPASEQDLIRAVWEEARDLIKKLEGSTVQRLRVEAGEYKIEIERGLASAPVGEVQVSVPAAASAQAPAEATAGVPELDGRHPIIAPLVGDVVDEGQTVAIVEAMKLMNQVKADQGGRVTEIVASDGEWVEFEQVLMYLEPIEE
jgi:biotin carboxyl carrier protein